jgi:predicted transcriptional regulator
MISFRVPDEVREAAERAAADEERSRSNWCVRAIREKLVREGYLSSPKTGLSSRGGRKR